MRSSSIRGPYLATALSSFLSYFRSTELSQSTCSPNSTITTVTTKISRSRGKCRVAGFGSGRYVATYGHIWSYMVIYGHVRGGAIPTNAGTCRSPASRADQSTRSRTNHVRPRSCEWPCLCHKRRTSDLGPSWAASDPFIREGPVTSAIVSAFRLLPPFVCCREFLGGRRLKKDPACSKKFGRKICRLAGWAGSDRRTALAHCIITRCATHGAPAL